MIRYLCDSVHNDLPLFLCCPVAILWAVGLEPVWVGVLIAPDEGVKPGWKFNRLWLCPNFRTLTFRVKGGYSKEILHPQDMGYPLFSLPLVIQLTP